MEFAQHWRPKKSTGVHKGLNSLLDSALLGGPSVNVVASTNRDAIRDRVKRAWTSDREYGAIEVT